VPDGLAIDIGCGWAKRPGFVGVDKDAVPEVDHRVDVEREPLPFADRSVGTIFTSHCLEHLADQALIYREMSRVAVNGATLEIWTPYAWTDEAFIYTHRTFFPSSTISTRASCSRSIGRTSSARRGSSASSSSS
jgi:predicted SAM-dependent methyltransferase